MRYFSIQVSQLSQLLRMYIRYILYLWEKSNLFGRSGYASEKGKKKIDTVPDEGLQRAFIYKNTKKRLLKFSFCE
jgi:hypothetical protein